MGDLNRRLGIMEMFLWKDFSEETVDQFGECFWTLSEEEQEDVLDKIFAIPDLTEKKFVEMLPMLNVGEIQEKEKTDSIDLTQLCSDLYKQMIDEKYQEQEGEWLRVGKDFYRLGFKVYAKLHKNDSISDMFNEIHAENILQKYINRKPTELEIYEVTKYEYGNILEEGIKLTVQLWEDMIHGSISTDYIMKLAEWVMSICGDSHSVETFNDALRIVKYYYGTSDFSMEMFCHDVTSKEELSSRKKGMSIANSIFQYQFTSMNTFPFDYPEEFEKWEYNHPEEAKYQRSRHGWDEELAYFDYYSRGSRDERNA